MKKGILVGGIVIVIVIIAIAIVSTIYINSLNQELSDFSDENQDLLNKIVLENTKSTEMAEVNKTMEDKLGEMEQQNQALQKEVDKHKEENESLEESLAETENELLDTQTEYQDLSSEYDDLRYSFARYLGMFGNEIPKLICDETITENRSGILSLTENFINLNSLQENSENNSDKLPVQMYVLNKSDPHRLSLAEQLSPDNHMLILMYIANENGEEHFDYFLLYLNKDGYAASTFWITEQCWVDPP